jgi:hypothetical protein
MTEAKTKPTDASVPAFIEALADPEQRADAAVIADMMQEVTGHPPVLWGRSIVGFGNTRYSGASGGSDWPLVGFSPRSRELTLYIMTGFGEYAALMKRLGKHKTGRACLYIKRLADVDLETLRQLVVASVESVQARSSTEETQKTKKVDPSGKTLPAGQAAAAKKKTAKKKTAANKKR